MHFIRFKLLSHIRCQKPDDCALIEEILPRLQSKQLVKNFAFLFSFCRLSRVSFNVYFVIVMKTQALTLVLELRSAATSSP